MKSLLLLALVVIAAGCSRQKPVDAADIYREVPDRDRESLRAAVRQLVEFQRSADWEKMYEITEPPKDEKERFIRRRSAARPLKDFVPDSVTWVPDGWVVAGCGTYQPLPKQPEALVSSLHAIPNPAKRGEWLFSAVVVDIVPGVPGNLKECSSSPVGGKN